MTYLGLSVAGILKYFETRIITSTTRRGLPSVITKNTLTGLIVTTLTLSIYRTNIIQTMFS